ncbi:MAG TPA: serine/threonine protein kinase, partial [Candidatus Dormibacteraeota bacterium]|nr:serine/threonine protein kinase [Candidatus Dormibacteraeota bacterium]
MNIKKFWPRMAELALLVVAGFLVTPVLPSLPTPPPVVGLPVPTPSVPSLQPTPLPTAVATPQPSAPAVQPTGVP